MHPLTALSLGRGVVWLLPLAALALGLRRARGSRVRDLMVRCRLLRPPPARATRPPLEQLAADLRRLYPDAHFPRAGLRMPKQRGILMAYDKRLCDTAAALEVTTDLVDLPLVGLDREAERLRVEHALAAAGLVWQVPPEGRRADPAA